MFMKKERNIFMTKPGDSPTIKKTIHELAKEFPNKTYKELEEYRNADRQEEAQQIPLTESQKESNREKSKIRSRVEHIFGVQSQRAGSLLLRGIGIVRAKTKIGLRNLSYNLSRYALLKSSG